MDFQSPEDYSAHHTRKQKEVLRKSLKKKIDTYNKKLKKKPSSGTLSDSLPISKPSEDLVYKGIITVVYDSGYALQSKSVLVESVTTVAQVIEDVVDGLKLMGGPEDYALEERDVLSGTNQLLPLVETPLQRKLGYGSQDAYLEFRLVELQSTAAGSHVSRRNRRSLRRSLHRADSDDSLEDGSSLVPKEEVTDHGISNIEITLEEGLQDIPPLVGEIQERLQTMVSTVAVDGVPKSDLPPRRMLWDILKPQAAQLVKEIRRCVDSCEFLVNRYCSLSVCKLIVSLLLELITDHSKELVSVTKELCALRGAPRTEFDISVENFILQINYISKLIGMCSASLRVASLTGHLLEVTSPNKFILVGTLQPESQFTGSGNVSGVLLFCVVSAYLGLIRAAYEEKVDYFASLAANVLKSAHRALDTIQKTDEYKLLHLHPLKSRVKDMEQKQKKSMDGLICSVRLATHSRAPPDTIPTMLLEGHSVLMSTLDYLMVAQCASLLHRIIIAGWELLQLPWVRGVLLSKRSGSDTSSEITKPLSLAPSLSSVATGSDNADDETISNHSHSQKIPRPSRRQKLLLLPTKREQGDGADEEQTSEAKPNVSFAKLGLRASRLQLTGDIVPPLPTATAIEEDNEIESLSSGRAIASDEDLDNNGDVDDEKKEDKNDALSSYTDQKRHSVAGASVAESIKSEKKETKSQSKFAALDALEKLRHNYSINKEIAKVAEGLLMTLTQKINILTMAVKEGSTERYTETATLIIGTAKQIREEVSIMESDLLVGQSMVEILNNTKQQFSSLVRAVHSIAIMASVSLAHDGSSAKLLNSAAELQTVSSETVRDALKALSEHKMALDQAEKIEQEFVSLMTGHQKYEEKLFDKTRKASIRKKSAPAKFMMASESEADKVITEQRQPSFKMGIQQWSAKGTSRVIGGTLKQLVDKLVYYRTIDVEFVDVFILTFHSFTTPMQLMKELIERYSITMPENLTDEEKEGFKNGVLIPVRLRVIQAMRSWLRKSYTDFKDEQLIAKLKVFISLINKFMPASAKGLQVLLKENQEDGPEHLREKPLAKPPPSIIPSFLMSGTKFDILDVNTLELARQMAIAYSNLFRQTSPEELMDTSEEVDCTTELIFLSNTITTWVTKEIVSERNLEDRASVISYFIQTANSCFELKNFEALFAVIAGLESAPVSRLTATWKKVSTQLSSTFKILCRVVSTDSDYQKYKREISAVADGPCVPYISLFLEEAANINSKHPEYLPQHNSVINFEKRRLFAQFISLVQCYQSIPYALTPVQSLQDKLLTMKLELTEQELSQLSWQAEMS